MRKSAKSKIGIVLSRLKKKYKKEMQTGLSHESSWELLVATMLSARQQDAQVNKVTPKLFKNYRNPHEYALLRPRDLELYIKTLGLYKTKARNIIETARIVSKEHGGKVPESMEELIELPGVGRKTANVVLSNAFDIHTGIAIDTHCITVANRLFLFNTNDAVKVEEKLMEFVPQSEWGNINHLFIALGRDVCTARKKYCERCVLNDICPSSDVK